MNCKHCDRVIYRRGDWYAHQFTGKKRCGKFGDEKDAVPVVGEGLLALLYIHEIPESWDGDIDLRWYAGESLSFERVLKKNEMQEL